MDCKTCAEDLSALLDGELGEARRHEIEGHLKACPPCHEELESLGKAFRLVESHLDEIEPRPEIWDKLQAKITASPRTHPAGLLRFLVSHRWTLATASLAASIVMGAGVWGYLNYQQSERTLSQYMNEYVRERDQQEHAGRAGLTNVRPTTASTIQVHLESAENPFADATAQETDNPFRSEAQ